MDSQKLLNPEQDRDPISANEDGKKVEFVTNQNEEEASKDEGNPEKPGRSRQGYQLKIAVSQRHYPANKKNSSHYTGWFFIPVNLFHQLQNPVFIFYLFIMVLEMIPQVSMTGGLPNTILPYSIVILIQMIVDFVICFKVNNLDWVQNSMKVGVIPGQSFQKR